MTTTGCPVHRPKPENDAFVLSLPDAPNPVNAYFGVQDRGGDAKAHIDALRAALDGKHGPDFVEVGRHTDVEAAVTTVYVAYWRDPAAFDAWRESALAKTWLTDPSAQSGPVGRWAEFARIETPLLETLYSHKVQVGLSTFADDMPETLDHGYWGGLRDRVDAYRKEDLAGGAGDKPADNGVADDTLGKTFAVKMPANVCLANGNGDWTHSHGQERDLYLNDVHPAFERANEYLRDEPEDAGCFSCHTLRMLDDDGNELDRVSLIAYFVALTDLERWTAKHKSHQEIFARFMKMVNTMKRMPEFQLWHEVSVLREGALEGVYINCLRKTGFLRFGRARQIPAT